MNLRQRYKLIIPSALIFLTACTIHTNHSIEIKSKAITLNTLKHELIVIQTRSMLEQRNIISKANHEQKLANHKITLDKLLTRKERHLLSCSRYQEDKNLDLALECADMANHIAHSKTSGLALKHIQDIIAANAQKQQLTDSAKRKRKRDALMALTKKQILQTNHSATIKTLKELLVIAPNDAEAKQLLKELKSIQEKHVIELINMGDFLYKGEKIEQALAVWKAAKNLATNNKEVLQRIDRAEKVLDSVNKIKELPLAPK